MRTIEIQVLTGVSAGDKFTYSLSTGDSIQIGRTDSNDLVLSDPRISRTHCGFLAREDAIYIYDLGSAAGTIHMGFKLQTGEAGAKPLGDGDEFKIGDSLFRVSVTGEATISSEVTKKTEAPTRIILDKRKKVIYGAVVAAVVVLALVFLFPAEKKSVLPKQYSRVALNLPTYRLRGYWPGSRSTVENRKDNSHLDKVQFLIPATNHLIEYEYISQTPISVLVDGVEVDDLPEHSVSWRRKQLLIRDVAQGEERKLVFDNLSYPSKKKVKKHKKWAVRNVRVTPIERPLDASVEEAIQAASALADDFDKSPQGLFVLVRALQRVSLELLVDQSADFASLSIYRDETASEFDQLDAAEVTETLDAIESERLAEYESEMDARHLQAVNSLISTFDGELWRRVDSRIRQAKHSADAENSIVVYDNLVAIKTMFPDETDYRWVLANRMLNDEKYVSKKVRRNPGRYRR